MASVTVKERDLGWKRIMREVEILDDSFSSAGLFGHGGDPGDDVAARGAIHEFGSRDGKIPKRPFMAMAFESGVKDLMKTAKTELAEIYQGRQTARGLLSRMGEEHVGQIKEMIITGSFDPLKPATIKAKGSSRPLIDTAQMRNAITHKEFMKK